MQTDYAFKYAHPILLMAGPEAGIPSPSSVAKQEFTLAIRRAMGSAYPDAKLGEEELMLSISAPQGQEWDMSSSAAFRLAKKLSLNPAEIASTLAASMAGGDYLAKVEAANGYVNAKLDEQKYAELVLGRIKEHGKGYCSSGIGAGIKVIVESQSINPAHPWSVGHLRNALLGDVVANVFERCSFQVERENYIDDLGLQAATALYGYTHISDKPDKKFDQWLGEIYVKASRSVEEQGAKAELDAIVKRMEETGTKEAELGRQLSEKCLLAQQETAAAYGISQDVLVWESDVVRSRLMERALSLADEHGIFERPSEGKYAGATVVKIQQITRYAKELEGSREEAKVIIRSSGAATYIAKDFAFHTWKFGLIDAGFRYRKMIEKQTNGKPLYTTSPSGSSMRFGTVKKAINIIDSGQSYEQKIMRIMFSLMGNDYIANNIVHLAYGKVDIEGAKLTMRMGTWLGEGRNYTADDLLVETRKRAMEIAEKSKKISDMSRLDAIANAVALSAIKFEYLRVAPEKSISFSWERALNFDANSGPYVLYTYARARRILSKAGYSKIAKAGAEQMTRGHDFQLVKVLGEAQDTIEKACQEIRPNVVTDYLLGMASFFSKFYENMPVIGGGDAMETRLNIVAAFAEVVRSMLLLLGIETVEEL